jgi:uncharacterized protein YggE
MSHSRRLIAVAGAILCIGLTVSAAFADTQRVLSVSGHGEAAGIPDQGQLSVGVTTVARTAAEALAQNAQQMNSVFAALKRIGVAERKIHTSNFNVTPQYPPYNNNQAGVQKISGYAVGNQVDVTVDDVKKIGPALDALVAAGANQINSVNFSIADPKPLLATARADAVADAIDRAQTYAKAAGVKLGAILAISDSETQVSPPVPMLRAMAANKAEGTPVAEGEQTVSANVNITWEIL